MTERPAKAGEATVAWADECEVCGHPLLEHAKVTDDLGDYLACVLCDGVMCAHIDGSDG